jgi:hypothetical protein
MLLLSLDKIHVFKPLRRYCHHCKWSNHFLFKTYILSGEGLKKMRSFYRKWRYLCCNAGWIGASSRCLPKQATILVSLLIGPTCTSTPPFYSNIQTSLPQTCSTNDVRNWKQWGHWEVKAQWPWTRMSQTGISLGLFLHLWKRGLD